MRWLWPFPGRPNTVCGRDSSPAEDSLDTHSSFWRCNARDLPASISAGGPELSPGLLSAMRGIEPGLFPDAHDTLSVCRRSLSPGWRCTKPGPKPSLFLGPHDTERGTAPLPSLGSLDTGHASQHSPSHATFDLISQRSSRSISHPNCHNKKKRRPGGAGPARWCGIGLSWSLSEGHDGRSTREARPIRGLAGGHRSR